MLELIVFFMLAFYLAACFYSPERSIVKTAKFSPPVFVSENSSLPVTACKVMLPEDSMLRRHFLTQLQSEIEAALFPRPTDSVLQRHYDALVATELENRLAG